MNAICLTDPRSLPRQTVADKLANRQGLPASECAVKPARAEQVQQDQLTAGRHVPAAACGTPVLGRLSKVSTSATTLLLDGLKRDLMDRDNGSFNVGDRLRSDLYSGHTELRG